MKNEPAVRGETVEELHQEAAGHYLEGDYPAALAAWQRLLEIDPGDAQAIEGVRLCEGLIGSSAERAPAAPEPVSSETTTADEDSFVDFLDLDDNDHGTASATVPESSPALESLKDSLEQLDLEVDGLTGSGGSVEDEFVEVTSISQDEGKSFDAEVTKAEAEMEVEAAAAAELRRRVNELLASALAAMEGGDRDTALSLLSRVAILDEDNEAARSLQEMIRQEVDAEGAASEAPPAEDRLSPEPWDDDELVAPEAAAFDAVAGERASERPAPPPLAELPEISAESGSDERVAPEPEAPCPAAAPTARPGLRLRPPPWVLGLAGVAVVATLGLFVWQKLGAGARRSVPEAPPVAERPAALPSAGQAAPAGGTEPAPAEADKGDGLAAALGRAEAAFAAEDYGAAVLAYNEALAIAPDHARARSRLLVAGERYREQHEGEQRWEDVAAGFRSGDYRRSLQVLYRMPEGEDRARIRKALRSGWFNLGVLSLRSGDCESAQEHLTEAEAVADGDPTLLAAARLARSCPKERATDSYQVAVGALALRGLDD